jgi:hypothetical protein
VRLRVRKISLLLFTIGLAGCGGGPPEIHDTVDVSGTVTVDGKPVEGVEVHFMTDTFAGFGTTDSAGKYQLVQGAVPGENKVFFSKMEGGSIALDPDAGIDEFQLKMAAEAQGTNPQDIAHDIIPEQYRDPEKTKLKFPVPESGTNSADFKLTTK